MPTPPPEQTLVHFYRALVMHMDVWRQRMDATTNWAAATAAGMITFAFGTPSSPHFVLLLALAFQGVFLLMESRRYQTFDLWRRRFRTMNRHLVAPALRDDEMAEEDRAALSSLSVDLGWLVPEISLLSAAGYRIRRNYGYLFLVTLVAWALRLEGLAGTGAGLQDVVAQARIGDASGALVAGVVGVAALGGSVLAFFAPSERMRGWTAVPPPLTRWHRAGTTRSDEGSD
jgi:uncharacterized membrane protein